ncbi:hypothetical protein Tco_1052754, partial [Tanacetum coccineum]
HPSDSHVLTMKMEIMLEPAINKLLVGSYALSWKPYQGDSLNLPDHRIHKDGDGDASFQLKSDSLPPAHVLTTKTYYKHQDSRIMKAQELKTKSYAQTLIYKIFLQRYQVHQGRLLASFQDDAKYEHVGQDTRSLVELEYFFEEVYKATTDQLDWINPEGQQYPYDLRKPLPLIPNSRGHRVIPFDHFINNDLKYLSSGVSSRKYLTLVTKTKAADYRHIKWIEDLIPNRMWSQVPHLDWITVRRDDDKLYKFKEGDFNRLGIKDIEDMLLLLVQGKLPNLTVEECLAFNLPKEAQPHKADTYRSDLKQREAYIAYSNPRGFIYQNKDKNNRLMCIDELYKFSDGTLNDVWTALNDHLNGIQMKYLP